MKKLFVVFIALMLSACDVQPSARSTNIRAQEDIMDQATRAIPVPHISNFLAREAVAKQVKRLDEKGKLFYVYIIAPMGNTVGYYVANTRPVPTCSLLTPSEIQSSTGSGSNMIKTPSLGGTYSPNPSCSGVFFFDASTDAYIEISGLNYFVTDQPISLKAEPITVLQK